MRAATSTAQAIDDVLAGTFPASDPPAWTPGLARPAPEIGGRADETGAAPNEANSARTPDVIDVSRPADSERTFAQALVSLFGAAGLALLIPLAILAVGTPVALGVHGVHEVVEWFVTFVR
jgi:hypothetical protein